jgi:hypothetical protein
MGSFYFLVCPWLDPWFWKKDGWCPNTKSGSCYACFECVIDTKRHNMPPSVHYMPKTCIIRPPKKICVWAAPSCIWSSWLGWWSDDQTHLDWEIGQTGRTKKKDPLLIFNILFPFGRVENMWCINGWMSYLEVCACQRRWHIDLLLEQAC